MEYTKYLRAMIAQEEEALSKSNDKDVRTAIMRRIQFFKSDLKAVITI